MTSSISEYRSTLAASSDDRRAGSGHDGQTRGPTSGEGISSHIHKGGAGASLDGLALRSDAGSAAASSGSSVPAHGMEMFAAPPGGLQLQAERVVHFNPVVQVATPLRPDRNDGVRTAAVSDCRTVFELAEVPIDGDTKPFRMASSARHAKGFGRFVNAVVPDIPLPLEWIHGKWTGNTGIGGVRLRDHLYSRAQRKSLEERAPIPRSGRDHVHLESPAMGWEYLQDLFSEPPNAHFPLMPYPRLDGKVVNLPNLMVLHATWAGRIGEDFLGSSPFVAALGASLGNIEGKMLGKVMADENRIASSAHTTASALMDMVHSDYRRIQGKLDDAIALHARLASRQNASRPGLPLTREQRDMRDGIDPADLPRIKALRDFMKELKHTALSHRMLISGVEIAERKTEMLLAMIGANEFDSGTKVSTSIGFGVQVGVGFSKSEWKDIFAGLEIMLNQLTDCEVGPDGETNFKTFEQAAVSLLARANVGNEQTFIHGRFQVALDLFLSLGKQFKADAPTKMLTAKSHHRPDAKPWDSAGEVRRNFIELRAVFKNAMFKLLFNPYSGRADPDSLHLSASKATEGFFNHARIAELASRFASTPERQRENRGLSRRFFPTYAQWDELAMQSPDPASFLAEHSGYGPPSFGAELGGPRETDGRTIKNFVKRTELGLSALVMARVGYYLRSDKAESGLSLSIHDRQKQDSIPLWTLNALSSGRLMIEGKSNVRDKSLHGMLSASGMPIAELCKLQRMRLNTLHGLASGHGAGRHPLLRFQDDFDPLPGMNGALQSHQCGSDEPHLPDIHALYGDELPDDFLQCILACRTGRMMSGELLAEVDRNIAMILPQVRALRRNLDMAFNAVDADEQAWRIDRLNHDYMYGQVRLDNRGSESPANKIYALSLAIHGAYDSVLVRLSTLRSIALIEATRLGQSIDDEFAGRVEAGSAAYRQTSAFLEIPILAPEPTSRIYNRELAVVAPGEKVRTTFTGRFLVNLAVNTNPLSNRDLQTTTRSNALTPVEVNYGLQYTNNKAASNPVALGDEIEMTFTVKNDAITANILDLLRNAEKHERTGRGKKLLHELLGAGRELGPVPFAASIGNGISLTFYRSEGCEWELGAWRMLRVTAASKEIVSPNVTTSTPVTTRLALRAALQATTGLVEIAGGDPGYNLQQYRIHAPGSLHDGNIGKPGAPLGTLERNRIIDDPAKNGYLRKLLGGLAVPTVLQLFREAVINDPDAPRNVFHNVLHEPRSDEIRAAAVNGKHTTAGVKPQDLGGASEPLFTQSIREARQWRPVLADLKQTFQAMTPAQRIEFWKTDGAGMLTDYARLMAEFHNFNEFSKAFTGYRAVTNGAAADRMFGPPGGSTLKDVARRTFHRIFSSEATTRTLLGETLEREAVHRKELREHARRVERQASATPPWLRALRNRFLPPALPVGHERLRTKPTQSPASDAGEQARNIQEAMLAHTPGLVASSAAAATVRGCGVELQALPREEVSGEVMAATRQLRELRHAFFEPEKPRKDRLSSASFEPRGQGVYAPLRVLEASFVELSDTLPQALLPHDPQSPLMLSAAQLAEFRSALADYTPDEGPQHRGVRATTACVLINQAQRTSPGNREFADLHDVPIETLRRVLATPGVPLGAETLANYCRFCDEANHEAGDVDAAPHRMALVCPQRSQIEIYSALGLQSIISTAGLTENEAQRRCLEVSRQFPDMVLQTGERFRRLIPNELRSIAAWAHAQPTSAEEQVDAGERQRAFDFHRVADAARHRTLGHDLVPRRRAIFQVTPAQLDVRKTPADGDSLIAALVMSDPGVAQATPEQLASMRALLASHLPDASEEYNAHRAASGLHHSGQGISMKNVTRMSRAHYKELVRAPGFPPGPDAIQAFCRLMDASGQEGIALPTTVLLLSLDRGCMEVYSSNGMVRSMPWIGRPGEQLAFFKKMAQGNAVALVQYGGGFTCSRWGRNARRSDGARPSTYPLVTDVLHESSESGNAKQCRVDPAQLRAKEAEIGEWMDRYRDETLMPAIRSHWPEDMVRRHPVTGQQEASDGAVECLAFHATRRGYYDSGVGDLLAQACVTAAAARYGVTIEIEDSSGTSLVRMPHDVLEGTPTLYLRKSQHAGTAHYDYRTQPDQRWRAVAGDGDCLFHSVGRGLRELRVVAKQPSVTELRMATADEIRVNADVYRAGIPIDDKPMLVELESAYTLNPRIQRL